MDRGAQYAACQVRNHRRFWRITRSCAFFGERESIGVFARFNRAGKDEGHRLAYLLERAGDL